MQHIHGMQMAHGLGHIQRRIQDGVVVEHSIAQEGALVQRLTQAAQVAVLKDKAHLWESRAREEHWGYKGTGKPGWKYTRKEKEG